jgi:fructoselysine 6-kinase
MPNLTVAVVGDNTIDRYVGPRGCDYVGGNAVNVAVQLAERGLEVQYYGAVGTDREGALIRDTLADRQIDVTGLQSRPGATALTLISVDASGERHLDEEHFGVTAGYHPDEAQIERIADADWVQIGMLSRATELRAALRARRPKIRIGQDCSVAAGYRDLSVAFLSAEPAGAAAAAEAGLREGAELVVTTLGADGAIAFGRHGFTLEQAADPVDAVDTTGAGDSFIAGFVAAYLRSYDLAAAMAAGAAWAARTCTHIGGFPQQPVSHPIAPTRGAH